MQQLGLSSKFNTERPFLLRLRGLGAATTERLLADNFERIGRIATMDSVPVRDAELLFTQRA